ncbi:hypothetical protein BS47DRAFT_1359401 [Hydnum rufescens UP504]|uniref:BTB domain-containing protein n=1 Tax=Hydnum rufescens UP504 TaxID=1448309 RepID=A0A9P6E0B6_9AGAM|nr:hypothetical protein BS47DRAFT_1359401 [Hydnum rufescens UP504]
MSLSPANSSHSKPPLSPLSYDDGDVILRAGDTDFKVHMLLLRLSSPFFKSMFSLPQPKLENREIPVVPIEGDPAYLDFVLRSIYPGKRPLPTSIEEALKILEIADKFEVECIVEGVRASLGQLLAAEPNPLCSWAIAVRCGLREAERSAASVSILTGSSLCLKSWVMSTHSNMPGWCRRNGGLWEYE